MLDVSPGDILLILILLRPWIKVILTLPACGNSFALRRRCGRAATVRARQSFPSAGLWTPFGWVYHGRQSLWNHRECMFGHSSTSAPVHVFISM